MTGFLTGGKSRYNWIIPAKYGIIKVGFMVFIRKIKEKWESLRPEFRYFWLMFLWDIVRFVFLGLWTAFLVNKL